MGKNKMEPPFVATVRDGKCSISAATNVDGSVRLQTISRRQNPLCYDLILEFNRQRGFPVVINVSFKVRGEPIVCRPEDAWQRLMRTRMDSPIMGSFILEKDNPGLHHEMIFYEDFELDQSRTQFHLCREGIEC